MISHSTSSTPAISRGSRPSVSGSWRSSLKHGIWMISFIGPRRSEHTVAGYSPTMDAATVTEPRPAAGLAVPDSEDRSPRRLRTRAAASLRPTSLHLPALGLLLLGCMLLRLWGIEQGLPYTYNGDEATHFVPHAIGFFGHDLNPHYFVNPPAYSYLLYISLDLCFGGADGVRSAYTTDPTAVFVLARVLTALLGTAAVWLTWAAGARLFSRTVGLLAGAIVGLGFLAVFYSSLAL